MTNWYGKVSVAGGQATSVGEKLLMFVGHLDVRYYITPSVYMDLGAGSLGCNGNVKMAPPWAKGCIATIGRYCEINPSAEIAAGGEHANDRPVNVAFGGFPMASRIRPEEALRPLVPARIGNGVVISAGAKIKAGVKVGDGAVIGALAMVTKDVGPYSIVAGNPGRELSARTPAQPWWNFSVPYLLTHKVNGTLQQAAASDGPHEWRKPRPRIVIRNVAPEVEILGFVDSERSEPFSAFPDRVKAYLTQALGPAPEYWLADPWPD